jgi:hypothetical protein
VKLTRTLHDASVQSSNGSLVETVWKQARGRKGQRCGACCNVEGAHRLLDVVPGLAIREDSDSKFPFWGFARFPFSRFGGSPKIPVPSWRGKAPLSADLPWHCSVWPVRWRGLMLAPSLPPCCARASVEPAPPVRSSQYRRTVTHEFPSTPTHTHFETSTNHLRSLSSRSRSPVCVRGQTGLAHVENPYIAGRAE